MRTPAAEPCLLRAAVETSPPRGSAPVLTSEPACAPGLQQHPHGWRRASLRHYAMSQILLRRVHRAEGGRAAAAAASAHGPSVRAPQTDRATRRPAQCTVLLAASFSGGAATQRGEPARGGGDEILLILQIGRLCGT